VHPWIVRAEGEVVPFPSERVEAWARFDTFFEEEHERLYKALYFVTGNRHDAEELMQDAFLSLWERWGEIGRIDDPTGYLFRVALNGFRMRRRRAAMAVRKVVPVPDSTSRRGGVEFSITRSCPTEASAGKIDIAAMFFHGEAGFVGAALNVSVPGTLSLWNRSTRFLAKERTARSGAEPVSGS